MRIFFFLFVGAFFFYNGHGQEVQVLEENTTEPISGVAVSNRSRSKHVSTDIDGKANLDRFGEDEMLIFQSMLYETVRITKNQILDQGGVVYMAVAIEGLDEVVISASKFEQSKRDIPQKILNISAQDIQFSNPQTSADLLENTGNVYVQKSQLGGGSPMIRGFSTNRLLITVDGVRMNNAIFRGGNLQNVISIDPFSVQNTEITLGAGSIVYGSDAIGGVMSFYTKRPVLSNSDSPYFAAGSTVRYASANEEKTVNVNFNIGLERWAFLTNVSYSNFGDLRMGTNGPDDYLRPEYVVTDLSGDRIVDNEDPRLQVPTGYSQLNLMQKVLHQPNENSELSLGLFYTTTSDYSRYDRLIRYRGDELRSAEWFYGPQRWFMGNLQFTKMRSSSTLYDKFQTTLAYQNFQESRGDRDFQEVIRNEREEAVDAISANLDFEKSLNSDIGLFYGLEYVYNEVTSRGFEYNIETMESEGAVSRYPNGSDWQSLAAYTSIKYKRNENFILQSGIRYNHIYGHSNFTENNQYLNLPFSKTTINSDAITATAGFSYIPTEYIQLKTNLSTAFRAPNIDDIGKVFDSEPGSVVVPNPDLTSEYAYGADVGIRADFTNKLIVDASVFYTFLDDALVRRDYLLNGESQIEYDGELSNIQAIQNASKANIYGLELGIRYNFSEVLYLTSQYNIIRGTEEEDGQEVPVRHVSPDFGNTHLIYDFEDLRLDAFVLYNRELSADELAPSEVAKDYIYALDENGEPYAPSWVTLNLRTQYQFNKDFLVTLTLENIANKRYQTYSSGIASPGRNLIVSLNYLM